MTTEISGYISSGFGPRVSISIAAVMGWLVFVILFLLFLTGGMTTPQVVGVVIVSIIILAAILGITWASWLVKEARLKKQMSTIEKELEKEE